MRRQRLRTTTVVGFLVLVSACGGRVRDHSNETGEGPSSGGTPGSADMSGGTSLGGSSVASVSGAGGSTGGSGSSNGRIDVAGSSASGGSSGFGGTGGRIDDAAGNGGDAGGDVDPSCALVWGTPSDPGFRGLRGTLDGQPLEVPATDMSALTPVCGDDAPPPRPGLTAYIALPGMSLWLDTPCSARVTTPNETDWHQLEVEISGSMAKPQPENDLGYIDNVLMGGHLRLQGQALDGPFSLEGDVYLEVGVGDPCAPPQHPPG